MERLHKKISNNLILFLVFILFLFININVVDKFDDTNFKISYDMSEDIFTWIVYYWNTWSGRIFQHSLLVLLMENQLLFSIINSLMQVGLVYLLSNFIVPSTHNYKTKNIFMIIITIMYLIAIPKDIRAEADLWKTATVIYLWGIVAALYCIKFFYNSFLNLDKKTSKLEYIIAVIAAIYAAGCEQSAPLVIVFGILSVLHTKFILKSKIKLFDIILILVTFIFFIIFLMAPGNEKRVEAEILGILPFFNTYSLIENLFWQIIISVSHIFNNFYVLLLGITTCILIYNKSQKDLKLISYIPFGYFLILSIVKWCEYIFYPEDLVINLSKYIFNFMPALPIQISFSFFQWGSSILGVFIAVLIAMLILFSSKSKQDIINFLIYSASFMVIIIIGVSVGGRIIGLRTLFVTGVLLILLLVRYIQTIVNDKIKT